MTTTTKARYLVGSTVELEIYRGGRQDEDGITHGSRLVTLRGIVVADGDILSVRGEDGSTVLVGPDVREGRPGYPVHAIRQVAEPRELGPETEPPLVVRVARDESARDAMDAVSHDALVLVGAPRMHRYFDLTRRPLSSIERLGIEVSAMTERDPAYETIARRAVIGDTIVWCDGPAEALDAAIADMRRIVAAYRAL